MFTRKALPVAVALIGPLFLYACEGKAKLEEAQQAAKQMKESAEALAAASKAAAELAKDPEAQKAVKDAMAEAQAAMGAMGAGAAEGGAAVDPVGFRELKKLLPEKIGNLPRTSESGEKTGTGGLMISNATAEYKAGDAELSVQITDLAGMKGAAAFAAMGLTMAEIDRETETGFERTFKHGDAKGLEKYDKGDKSGEIQLIVANRFSLQIKGQGLESEKIRAALDAIDLKALAALKEQAPAAEAPSK